jgi:hypothetical protein
MQNSETDNIRTAQPKMLILGNYGDHRVVAEGQDHGAPDQGYRRSV